LRWRRILVTHNSKDAFGGKNQISKSKRNIIWKVCTYSGRWQHLLNGWKAKVLSRRKKHCNAILRQNFKTLCIFSYSNVIDQTVQPNTVTL
jgi:hypothetical protein